MSPSLELLETFCRTFFGNAPRLLLPFISHYQISGLVARMLSGGAIDGRGSGCSSSSKALEGESDPESPAPLIIIILTDPQGRDPVHVPPHPCTSFPRSFSLAPENELVATKHTSTSSTPRPEPEPHPAPPVIILSCAKRKASASSSSSSRIPSGPATDIHKASTIESTKRHRTMGSKASKIAPRGGKLQSSQEKKDKEEMKEPANYYSNRSKSMRRKAGKEAGIDAAGGTAGGSGGGAGGMA